jgi:hypothetical protein
MSSEKSGLVALIAVGLVVFGLSRGDVKDLTVEDIETQSKAVVEDVSESFSNLDSVSFSPESYGWWWSKDEVKVEEPTAEYKEKVKGLAEIIKKGPNPKKDGKDLANLYLAQKKALSTKFNGDYIVKRVEDYQLSNTFSGLIQTEDLVGKYEGLGTSLEVIALNALGEGGKVKAGTMSDAQRLELSNVLGAVAWACNEGAK